MRWAGHVTGTRKQRNSCRILLGNTEWKRQPGSPRYRWKDNIKVDLREVGWGGLDWIWLRIGTSGGKFMGSCLN
jgi:hypothetical protein